MWKAEYAKKRKDKYANDESEREKRKAQGRSTAENVAYMKQYYSANKDKFVRSEEQNDERNRMRRERYANNAEYRQQCREKTKEYQAKNPDIRANQRLKKYNITFEDYSAILKAQNYGCAICGISDSGCGKKSRLYVDHCHSTGKVRGLLCSSCNFGIGKFKDSPELLVCAAEYLKRVNQNARTNGIVI